jgi:2-hydroxychromene-2-carboxylate isomerase
MLDLPCFYTLSSPWSYLGGPQLQDIVRRHRVRLVLKPFDFQEVVPKTGGVPIRTRPQNRRDYHRTELARWRDYLGLPLNLEPRHYPMVNPAPDWNKHAGWMVIAAQQGGVDAFPLSHALQRALWAEERDISDPEVRRRVADENGYDGEALLAAEPSGPVQAEYRANGDEAERFGVFGSPTIVIDGQLFWGQDRYGFVDRALAQRGLPSDRNATTG